MIAEHSFAIYPLAIAASGGAAKAVPLRKDYVFDLDAMAAAIDDNTRIVFLGNPEQSDRHHLSQGRVAAFS